jgi:hypothetical protein
MSKSIKIFALTLIIAGLSLAFFQYQSFFYATNSLDHNSISNPSDNTPESIKVDADLLIDEEKTNDFSVKKPDSDHFINAKDNQLEMKECKVYFISLNNLVSKFFQKQDFSEEIASLHNAKLPKHIEAKLKQLKKFNLASENHIIHNGILTRLISIEKISNPKIKQADFLSVLSELQQYFYSSSFIHSCQS